MSRSTQGSWSVAVTARAPEYQVNEFLEHYVGLGADKVYIFFDDRDYADYDRGRFSEKVISFVCDDRYWETVYKAPPLGNRAGRPDAVEIRQGVNALFAREIMHSEWLLHVDVDEFIYVKKNVAEVLSAYPEGVFSVLLRTLEAVYENLKEPGQETDTVYFKKSVQQRELLQQIYPEELLKCASNGLWGTVIGKSFIRKHPEVKSMSVHWPTPVNASLTTNVPTYYIDLLHFEGQSYELFKEKFMIRVYRNVAKHMPYTYKIRLDIAKREYDKRGEQGLQDVYRSFYVMEPEMLNKAMELGIVVKLDWSLGNVSEDKILINNPIFDLGARLSNWGGTVVRSFHNSYLTFDSRDQRIKVSQANEILAFRNIFPVEIEICGNQAKLFARVNEKIVRVRVASVKLEAAQEAGAESIFTVHPDNGFLSLSLNGKYLTVSPDKEITIDRSVASRWERFYLKDIYPQIS